MLGDQLKSESYNIDNFYSSCSSVISDYMNCIFSECLKSYFYGAGQIIFAWFMVKSKSTLQTKMRDQTIFCRELRGRLLYMHSRKKKIVVYALIIHGLPWMVRLLHTTYISIISVYMNCNCFLNIWNHLLCRWSYILGCVLEVCLFSNVLVCNSRHGFIPILKFVYFNSIIFPCVIYPYYPIRFHF